MTTPKTIWKKKWNTLVTTNNLVKNEGKGHRVVDDMLLEILQVRLCARLFAVPVRDLQTINHPVLVNGLVNSATS
jgi:hypothetical protein